MIKTGQDIGGVVRCIKAGGRARLPSWNGKNMFVFGVQPVEINDGDENGPHIRLGIGQEDLFNAQQRPFLMLRGADGLVVPWTISQTDAFADTWETTDTTF